MPLLITKEKANKIIESREPKGKFLWKEDLVWGVINNKNGVVQKEELPTFEMALRWLSE
jgi:hypothetical protein